MRAFSTLVCAALACAGLSGCNGGSSGGDDDTGTGTGTDVDADGDADGDTDSDGDTDGDAGGDTDGDTDTDGDADGDTDTDGDADGDSDGDGDTDTSTDPGAGLVGTWGELGVTAVIAKNVPILGQQWSSTRSWLLVQIASDGAGHLTATEKACMTKIKVGGATGTKVSIPQSTIDHMKPTERLVTVTSSAPGTAFQSDIVYDVAGVNLCDPVNDPLPAALSAQPNDSTPCSGACTGGQCDQDEDGHPGVTSKITGLLSCSIYAAVRGWSRLDGSVADADTISGAITDCGSEQSLLAASSQLCKDQSSSTIEDDACAKHHYFKMVRLADGATCADVLALTDCDEAEGTCDNNTVQPLDPTNDKASDCP
ncbi:MAG: hypothetical protein PHU25_15760 [Deltaproteobacteria bacterium]|nr:hypothetical protein [Deltaproteobacteria bacterium]